MNHLLRIALLFVCCLSAAFLEAADYYPELRAGEITYLKAHVLSANESSLSIRHSKGLSQVKLANLNDEIQAKYGYDSGKDQQREQAMARSRQQQVALADQRLMRLKVHAKERALAKPASENSLTSAFASFGETPTLEVEIDLRIAFRKHSLSVRNQGFRPSCSIHSIVAALEYQYAEFEGSSVNISEQYLFDATSRSTGRIAVKQQSDRESEDQLFPVDAGFALEHVFQAIRGYGLALEKGKNDSDNHEYELLNDVKFSPYQIPGGNSDTGIQNIIHILNANMPVVAGMAWPSNARVRNTSLVSKQPPAEGAGHAVALVGYRCPDGIVENTKFIFRNSWGPKWGAGGYGFVTYEYLRKNMYSCYVVELR